MKIIGITGTMGAGKSVAAGLLATQGVPVFNADTVLHAMWFEPAIQNQLINLLGDNKLIERADVKAWLNLDTQKLQQLEGALYPILGQTLEAFLTTHKQQQAPYVVLDIPLLFEKSWDSVCTQTICMVAPNWLCRKRVLQRPNTTENFYNFIVQQHWSQSQKAAAAHYVINSLWGKTWVAWRLRCLLNNQAKHKKH